MTDGRMDTELRNSPNSITQSVGYRADVDGLRAIAVLAVLFFHAFPGIMPGGFVGVDVFFVISGYLITSIIQRGLQAGRFSFSNFYFNRVRRIFPALVFVMTACLALGSWLLYAPELKSLLKHTAFAAAFLANYDFWKNVDYFSPGADLQHLLHLWSLGIEEQFYLIWPALFALAYRFGDGPRALRWTVILMATLSFGLSLAHAGTPTGFYAPWFRFWELLLGALLSWPISERSKRIRNTLGFLGAVGLVAAFGLISGETPFPGAWALLPCLSTALLLLAGPRSFLSERVLSRPGLNFIGRISYPLYLWHWPLLVFARILSGGHPSPGVLIVVLALSFGLSWLTYAFVENPFRFGLWKPHWPILCGLMACLLGLSHWGAHSPRWLGLGHAHDLAVPDSTRYSDGSCERLLSFSARNGQVCLANSASPKILVLGDSHAMAFASAAFVSSTLGSRPPVLLIGGHTCLPFMSYLTVNTLEGPGPSRCGLLAEDALSALEKFPSIREVWLITRGTVYVTGKVYGTEAPLQWRHIAIRRKDSPLASESNLEAFAAGYKELILALQKTGRSVTFVQEPPELGVDPHVCLERPLSFAPRNGQPLCTVGRSSVIQRRAQVSGAVNSLKAAFPSLRVFDPTDVLCDAERCFAKRDGKWLYFDWNHLNPEGSRRVMSVLLGQEISGP